MQTNRRTAKRLESVGLTANIFDGSSAVLGVVEDVSRCGMRVSTIPAAFNDRVETCYAVVNSDRRDFHLALHPRWVAPKARGAFKTIGFEIDPPSEEWAQCIALAESEHGAGMDVAA